MWSYMLTPRYGTAGRSGRHRSVPTQVKIRVLCHCDRLYISFSCISILDSFGIQGDFSNGMCSQVVKIKRARGLMEVDSGSTGKA